jgi:putative membrane protein
MQYSRVPMIALAGATLMLAQNQGQTPTTQTGQSSTGQTQTGQQTGQSSTGQTQTRQQTGQSSTGQTQTGQQTGQSSTGQTQTGQQAGQSNTGQTKAGQNGQTTGQTGQGTASRTGTTGTQLGSAETRFVQEALEGGRHEVELGRLALNQAKDSKVKSLAQRLVNDHQSANQKLEAIAKKFDVGMTQTSSSTSGNASSTGATSSSSTTSSKGNTSTTAANSPTQGDTSSRDRSATAGNQPANDHEGDMKGLKGEEFDRAYVQQMVQNHRSGIQKYETAQRDVTNADLKNYISSTLPTLRQHLEQAETLQKDMK